MGNDNGKGLFERLEHEIQVYNETWGSMEAKLNCNGLQHPPSVTLMIRKHRMMYHLRSSGLNVQGVSLSFWLSAHH